MVNCSGSGKASAESETEMKILISACLLGMRCRYDGASKAYPGIEQLARDHTLVPVCPEQLGGLATPRPPS